MPRVIALAGVLLFAIAASEALEAAPEDDRPGAEDRTNSGDVGERNPNRSALPSRHLDEDAACTDSDRWPFEAGRPDLEMHLRLARQSGDHRREAQLLVLLSDEALGRGEFKEAASHLDLALPLVPEQIEPWARAEILAQKAALAHRLGRLSDATDSFDRSLELARSLPQEVRDCGEPVYAFLAGRLTAGKFEIQDLVANRTVGLAFSSMTRLAYGRLLHELRRPQEAIHQLAKVLDASSWLGPSLDAQAHYLLGAVKARQGHLGDAKESFQLALAAMGGENCSGDGLAFPMTCFETLAGYADLLAAEGKLGRALELSSLAAGAARSLGDPVQELHVLSRRCNLYPHFGDASPRTEIWKRGEEILRELPEESDRVTASIYVSVMASCAGFHENALAHALVAEELLGDDITPEYEQLFRTMRLAANSMAGALDRAAQETGRRHAEDSVGPRALPAEQNFACWSEIATSRGKSNLMKIKALIGCMAAGDSRFVRIQERLEDFNSETSTERWLELIDQVVDLSPESHRAFFRRFLKGVRIQESEGRSSPELLESLRRIVADCQQRGNSSFQKISQAYSHGLLHSVNQVQALDLAKERLVAGERCLRGARLDETFLRLAEQSRGDFEVLATLQARNGLFAEAFHTAERARAFSLMRWLGRPGPDLHTEAESDLYLDLQASKAMVQSLQTELDQADPSQVKSLRSRLEKQRERQDDLLLRLKLTTGEYSELAANQVGDLPRVQRGLEEGVVLVSYFTMADQTLAWVIERDRWRHALLPVKRETLESNVHDMRRWLELGRGRWTEDQGRGALVLPDAGTIRGRESAKELYLELIEPLGLDGSENRLLLVPHGALQRLPFAALKDPSTGAYLVQRFPLNILPSASSVLVWRNADELVGDGSEKEFLVLGDPQISLSSLAPLPHARAEALGVADLLGTSALVNAEAKESVVRQQASVLSLLAIAAHGVQNPVDPRRSFLALAADGLESTALIEHDGRLEMGEIFDEVRFSKQPLVVLSACETGLGRRAGGDEVEGFIRAFLFAGAGAVAATLWPIDDKASSMLMQSFFRHLKAGKSASDALRQAQLQILDNPRFAAPYFWAGFSITGNPAIKL